MKYSRGSEWRKWDLHVHTPESVLNNGFGTDWDKYVRELFNRAIKNEIAVIGITDYFSINGYKKLMQEYLKDDRKLADLFAYEISTDPEYISKIHKIKIFPNIEFRFKDIIQKGDKDGKIEGHIIISDEIAIDYIEAKFFASVKFNDILNGQISPSPLIEINIKNFGNRMKQEQEEFAKSGKSDYRIGLELLEVDLANVMNVLRSSFKDKFIFLLPEDDITTINWKSQGHMVRKKYYYECDGFFTTNEKTIQWGLRDKTAEEFRTKKASFSYSDCHNFNEMFKFASNKICWVKADPTFEGFKQVFFQPNERVFVGDLPEKIKQADSRKYYYIDRLIVNKNVSAKNKDVWFDTDLMFNTGLVAIIGNKGSGKSALADIIGYMTEAKNMNQASFLNKDRFRKEDKKFAKDYQDKLWWRDERLIEKNYLDESSTEASMAEFLPQKYIEILCNELRDEFQQEINKVIFSYIDVEEKQASMSLPELIAKKTGDIDLRISKLRLSIEEINNKIIEIENKKTSSNLSNLKVELQKKKNILKSHLDNKPIEVPRPDDSDSTIIEQVERINLQLANVDEQIKNTRSEKLGINIQLERIRQFIDKYKLYDEEILTLNEEATQLALELNIQEFKGISLSFDVSQLTNKTLELEARKKQLDAILSDSDTFTDEAIVNLVQKRKGLLLKKEQVLESAKENEIKYEKYLKDLEQWENDRKKIEGENASEPNTIAYYEAEISYIENQSSCDWENLCIERISIVKDIYEQLMAKMQIYRELYAPVENKLKHILNDNSDEICFETTLSMDKSFSSNLLSYIKQNVKSDFYGKTDGNEYVKGLIREVNLDTWNGVAMFVEKLQGALSGEIDTISKLIRNVSGCYNFVNKLEYLNVSFTLRMNGKNLDELSPGQRGIVLLIFYLALSKNSEPLIIDQPEDNLDNQSVFKKLVPCILEAKKNRQVFIVTHNPNIAVACDAEQIICSEIDKTSNKITYISGSIENEQIKQKVIDILEGTEPAFSLRKNKYFH